MLQVLLSQNKSYKWTNRENIYFLFIKENSFNNNR